MTQAQHEAEMRIDPVNHPSLTWKQNQLIDIKWKQHLKEVVDKSIADGSYMMVSGTHFQNPREKELT